MKILFVWSYWQYPEVAIEFLRRIRQRGHHVIVLISEGQHLTGPDPDDIEFCFLPSCNIITSLARTPYPILKHVRQNINRLRPDIVHAHSHLFLSSYQSVKAAHSSGIPSVVTVHGVTAQRDPLLNLSQDIYIRTIARSLFGKASAVICLTKSDAQRLASIIGGYDKISIVPNGVDTEFFKPSGDKREDLVVWVGRFVPEKGVEYLVSAAEMLVQKCRNVKFLLVGEGPLRPRIEGMVDDRGLSSVIEFAGSLDRKSTAKILSEATILAFPSLKEGMPLAVLEAMASNTPVVGSDISGIRDVITNGWSGILVPRRRPQALADAMFRLLHDEDLRWRIGQNARQLILRRYSWGVVVDRIEEAYGRVVDASNEERVLDENHWRNTKSLQRSNPGLTQ